MYAFKSVLILLLWFFYYYYFQGYEGLFSNITFIFNIKFWKAADTCFYVLARWWRPYFFDDVCDTTICSKMAFSLCHWKRCHVLFFLVWSVRANGGPVVVSSFFFLLFSLFQLKYMPAPFSFLILVLMFFIFNFHHWPF